MLQREQLAQQKSQLDQIQSLQQQLQQQLVEQKRQKAAAAAQSMQVSGVRIMGIDVQGFSSLAAVAENFEM